ncbi:MAG TPA: Hpt domain-containing protein, partial [Nevskiaceae bacterium]|nr:Hpt domain-containing protein [Nevskiaceae bacterium]
MDRSPARISAGLRWVRTELEANLQLARQFVEQHSENRDDPVPLAKALALLHEVRGSSTLIQGYGVALLAEEMKQAVQDLSGKKLREPDAAYGAIVAACLQLADYLDALAGGGDDCAIILQPIINELRLARGKTLLSEEDLFVAQFNALALKLPKPESSVAPTAQIEGTRLAPVFSASLLNWFKDVESAPSLSRIGRIAEHMADASREQQLFQMWRTAAACVESLLSGGLDQSLEIKRQFGRAGQLLRILSEQGESVAVRHVTDLSYRLLFYVGRSRTAGPRVGAMREALALNAWLPDPETVKARRARLRGPNTQLLARVSEELRADLAEVKDSIDVAIRAGGGSTEEFDATTQRLKRVADTLQVLGLSEESRALAQPLETLATGMVDPGNRAWNEFATAVLRVELSLDTALVRQLHPQDPDAPAAPEPPSADYREGTIALYRESLVNLARLKTAIEAYLKTGDAHGLPDGVRLLDEVAAGLRIQGLTKAEEYVLGIQRYMQSPEFGNVRAVQGGPERFADTIAATEYYLEARRDALPGSELILEDLGYRVRRLQEAAIVSAQEAAPATAAPSAEPAYTDTVAPATMPAAASTPAPAGIPSAEVDPEIREVFLEESEEVLETLQRALPRWLRAPDERELLVEIRRAFHTLKGSGRMVGATEVGEFSWAIENLLNRTLDRTIELTPPVIDTVRDAIGL